MLRIRVAGCVACLLALSASAAAQARTDVVVLRNGDAITGEIYSLERGQLQFKTDDAGTLSIKWEKVVRLTGKGKLGLLEVRLADGRVYLGQFEPAANGQALIVGGPTPVEVALLDIVEISRIGAGFWSRVDGSLDLGLSYTQSSGVAQFNGAFSVAYRQPAFEFQINASSALTRNPDADDTGNTNLSLQYLRLRSNRWFAVGFGSAERNLSLGIDLRALAGAGVGRLLLKSNRTQLQITGGISVNEEVSETTTNENVEAVGSIAYSFFTYDTPKTNIDTTFATFTSLNDLGRTRLNLDASLKREIVKDFFLALSVYEKFDSRPPTAEAMRNDVGVVTSVGWSF